MRALAAIRIAGGRAEIFPQFFPIPDAVGDFLRQRESKLMREHADLAAMVSFVSKHVAEHLRADRPRLGPAIAVKLFDTAAAAERFGEHLRAASGAIRQCRAGLLLGAMRTVKLRRNFQLRSGKPDPLGADIVDVSEDRGDGANFSGRFGLPGGGVEMFDQNLVDAIVDGEDLRRGAAKLRVNRLGLNFPFTRGHGSQLLELRFL